MKAYRPAFQHHAFRIRSFIRAPESKRVLQVCWILTLAAVMSLQSISPRPWRIGFAAGAERVVSIVGVDEVDLRRALMKSAAGDSVVLQAPRGTEYLDVLEVC